MVRALFGAAMSVAGTVYSLANVHAHTASAATTSTAELPVLPAASGGAAEPDGALYTTSGDYAGFSRLGAPVVGWAAHPGGGAWEVATDGGVFARRAPFYGSLGRIRLAQPIVGMASTPDGRGYWLVAADGGIFSFGDARFHGSLGRVHLTQPIVGMAPTADGKGYWLVAGDGGIFAFGNAHFYGSLGRVHLAQPIVAMAPASASRGYWLVGANGSVFGFGLSGFHGSVPGHPTVPAVDVTRSGSSGYAITMANGAVWQFLPGSSPRLAARLPVAARYLAGASQRLSAQRAIAVALAQVGKPYTIGGNGPSTFDCSGLTKYAYAAAGVTLPRTAAEQLASVRHVSLAEAQPGDLLFFYPGIEHVGIYLGDGLMVDAPHVGAFVRVEQFSPWFGPVMGVGRPG